MIMSNPHPNSCINAAILQTYFKFKTIVCVGALFHSQPGDLACMQLQEYQTRVQGIQRFRFSNTHFDFRGMKDISYE